MAVCWSCKEGSGGAGPVVQLCDECQGIADTLTQMQDIGWWSESITLTESERGAAQAQMRSHFKSARGPPIVWMMERITLHPLARYLDAECQATLAHIGRFDVARSTADNNYVRATWALLCEWTTKMRRYQTSQSQWRQAAAMQTQEPQQPIDVFS